MRLHERFGLSRRHLLGELLPIIVKIESEFDAVLMYAKTESLYGKLRNIDSSSPNHREYHVWASSPTEGPVRQNLYM